jgi:hypothetical protein
MKIRCVSSGKAAIQESLECGPRNSVPKKSLALKARFNSDQRNTVCLTSCYALSALGRYLFPFPGYTLRFPESRLRGCDSRSFAIDKVLRVPYGRQNVDAPAVRIDRCTTDQMLPMLN